MSTEFAPQLNVQAFGSFLFIAVIFSWLQFRVSAIGQAAEKQTVALDELRAIKRQELSEDVDAVDVERALERYREAVMKVEDLRTVIPGLARIVPPPSQTVTRERMDENVAAAKQFLDLNLEAPSPRRDEGGEDQRSLPAPLAVLLAVVAVSQIGLLSLLMTDPMAQSELFSGMGP